MPESYNLLDPSNEKSPAVSNPPVAGVSLNMPDLNPVTPAVPVNQPVAEPASFNLMQEPTAEVKPGGVSSVQMANKSEDIIENIVKQATDTTLDEKQILQDLEQMDPSLELDVPVASENALKKRMAKMFFVVTGLIAVLSCFYYLNSTQNFLAFTNIDFVTESQKKLTQIQSEKVMNNYLSVAIAVDELALQTSKLNFAYLHQDTFSRNQNSQNTLKILESISSNLLEADKDIKSNPDISAELLIKLNDEVNKYNRLAEKEVNPSKKASYSSLAQIYTSAAKLSVNSELLPLLKSQSNLSGVNLLPAVQAILSNANYTPSVKVALVELTRTNWTDIFAELQSVVGEYDPAFNIFQNSNNYVVAFNNYTLNSDTRQVNVSGEVNTRDSRTFTLIANLIDSLEESPLFTNLNYTTFAKSYDQEGSIYSSNLNLSFQLEAN